MHLRAQSIICGMLAFGLAGCAHDALLREETGAFAKHAGAAAEAGITFYDDVVGADRALRTTLIVLDRNCLPAEINAGHPALCTLGEAKVPIGGVFTPETFEREYAQLRFLASYIGALAKFAGDIDSNSGANFEAAKEDLEAFRALFGNGKPVLDDDRTEAVSSLLDFLNQLANESASAKQIRLLLETQGEHAATALETLATGLLEDNVQLESALRTNAGLQRFIVRHGLVDDPGTRGALLTSYYAAGDLDRATTAKRTRCLASDRPDAEKRFCGAPAAGLMHAAADAHRELVVLSTGTLNVRQRARLARLSYERFVTAVKLFVDLRSVF